MKNKILNQIYDFFVNSTDYNGISSYDIYSQYESAEEVDNAIVELIREGLIETISTINSTNIHINMFGFKSAEKQIYDIQDESNDAAMCCYPSSKYLKEKRDATSLVMLPFDKMLALGTPQFKLQFFQWDVLDKYSEDPRFDFKFVDYEGKIYSTDQLSESEYIALRTFGTGRDSKDQLVVAVYTRYLQNMSALNQLHWYSKIVDNTNCNVLQAYRDNKIGGRWFFPDSVYTSILKEMDNINQVTNFIWGCDFFKKSYLENRPENFCTIFSPTLKRYNNFILEVEKIVPNNIDPIFFDTVHNDGINADGEKKGTIHRFKEWLVIVQPKVQSIITDPISKIRKLRQAPAHKIENNIYDYSYFEKQIDLAKELWEALRTLRLLISTHPKVKEVDLKVSHKTDQIVIP